MEGQSSPSVLPLASPAAAMAEESQPQRPLLRATEEPSSSAHSLLMVLGKVLFAALPLAGVAIGAVYLGQCPRQPLLPIYLIILSAVTLVLLFLSCIPCGDGTNRPSTLLNCLQGAGFLFLCVWFIAGNVWVYSIYPPDYEDVGQPGFCQQTLFLFAFGVTTAIHAALAVALLLALSILVGILVLNTVVSGRRRRRQRQSGLPGKARKPKAAQPRGLDPRGRSACRRGGDPWPNRSRANPGLRPLPPRPPSPEGSACEDSPEVDFFRFRRAQRAWLGSHLRLLAAPAGHGGGGGGGGPHARPGAHPGPDRLPGHQRRRRPGVGRRPGERRAHGGRDGGAGEHGLRLPAAAGPGAALPPRLRGLRGTLPAGDRLRPEALRGEAAQQRPGARGRLSGPRVRCRIRRFLPVCLRRDPIPPPRVTWRQAGLTGPLPLLPPAPPNNSSSSRRKEREANAPPPP